MSGDSERAMQEELDAIAKAVGLETYGYDEVTAAVRNLVAERDQLKAQVPQWIEAIERERCQKCKHPWGPIRPPKGLAEDGYVQVWTCPCDCHADVPALRAERDKLRAALSDMVDIFRDKDRMAKFCEPYRIAMELLGSHPMEKR